MRYSLLGQVAFWVLIIWGWATDGFTLATRITFVALWLAGYFAFPYLLSYGSWWFQPYVAVLATVMVFIAIKDDVRLN